jgi:hypothetical protein
MYQSSCTSYVFELSLHKESKEMKQKNTLLVFAVAPPSLEPSLPVAVRISDVFGAAT